MAEGMIPFNVDAIREHIICPLCYGIYREPYTTLKCSHTFCKSCLMVSLRANYFDSKSYNVCPAIGCEEYFGLSRDVGKIALADRTLETVINKVLFPELIQQDEEQEKAFYRSRGIDRKESARQSPEAPEVQSSSSEYQKLAMIKIRLEPTGDSPSLDRPIIETNGNIRIKTLKKYLAGQLSSNEDTRGISIFCHDALLGDELSAVFIQRSVWMETDQIMTLSYRVSSSNKLQRA